MKLELEEIANGWLVEFYNNVCNKYYKFYKTEKKAIKAMHRAIDRYHKKGEM